MKSFSQFILEGPQDIDPQQVDIDTFRNDENPGRGPKYQKGKKISSSTGKPYYFEYDADGKLAVKPKTSSLIDYIANDISYGGNNPDITREQARQTAILRVRKARSGSSPADKVYVDRMTERMVDRENEYAQRRPGQKVKNRYTKRTTKTRSTKDPTQSTTRSPKPLSPKGEKFVDDSRSNPNRDPALRDPLNRRQSGEPSEVVGAPDQETKDAIERRRQIERRKARLRKSGRQSVRNQPIINYPPRDVFDDDPLPGDIEDIEAEARAASKDAENLRSPGSKMARKLGSRIPGGVSSEVMRTGQAPSGKRFTTPATQAVKRALIKRQKATGTPPLGSERSKGPLVRSTMKGKGTTFGDTSTQRPVKTRVGNRFNRAVDFITKPTTRAGALTRGTVGGIAGGILGNLALDKLIDQIPDQPIDTTTQIQPRERIRSAKDGILLGTAVAANPKALATWAALELLATSPSTSNDTVDKIATVDQLPWQREILKKRQELGRPLTPEEIEKIRPKNDPLPGADPVTPTRPTQPEPETERETDQEGGEEKDTKKPGAPAVPATPGSPAGTGQDQKSGSKEDQDNQIIPAPILVPQRTGTGRRTDRKDKNKNNRNRRARRLRLPGIPGLDGSYSPIGTVTANVPGIKPYISQI